MCKAPAFVYPNRLIVTRSRVGCARMYASNPTSLDGVAYPARPKETRAATLLGGWRGRPPGDVDAAARTVARLSELVADLREEIREVEINPLAVLERGVLALDCVIVPREEASS